MLCNSFLLSSYVGDRSKGCGHEKGQWEFRDKLITQLFERAKSQGHMTKRHILSPKSPSLSPGQEHTRVRRAQAQDCRGCSIAGQSREPSKKRRALEEISGNLRLQKRPRRTVYRWKACVWSMTPKGVCARGIWFGHSLGMVSQLYGHGFGLHSERVGRRKGPKTVSI